MTIIIGTSHGFCVVSSYLLFAVFPLSVLRSPRSHYHHQCCEGDLVFSPLLQQPQQQQRNKTTEEVRTGMKPTDVRKEVKTFIRLGGFPVVHIGDYDEGAAYRIVHDIYSSAILRDTVQRYNIRNIELLERVVKYVFDNIGTTFCAKNVADYFKSQQRKVDLNTVYNYVNALESAYIIRKIPRYDVKGKEILQTNEKYYIRLEFDSK